jgi:tRNA (Thr-GGU) A37 N-methylase
MAAASAMTSIGKTVNCYQAITYFQVLTELQLKERFRYADDILIVKRYPVTGLGGLQGCEMLWILHCLDNRLTNGKKVVRPTHGLRFTPQGLVRPEGLGKLEKKKKKNAFTSSGLESATFRLVE